MPWHYLLMRPVSGLLVLVLLALVLLILSHRPAVVQKITPLHNYALPHQASFQPRCTAGEALTPQHRLKAGYIGKRHQSNSKTPPHRLERHQIDVDKGVGIFKKARPSVGVMALWPSLFRAGQHARNQTGILDRSGGKPAGLRLRCALRRHAKNNAR